MNSSTSKAKAIGRLLSEFKQVREEHRAARLSKLKAFISEYETFLDGMLCSSYPKVNMHKLYDLGADELRQSRFLAWLFNYRGSHGQRHRFLEMFVGECGLGIRPADLCNYSVRRELPGPHSIVDIAIYRKGTYVIFVENKLYAGEGYEQIDREYADLVLAAQTLDVPRQRAFAVFLTLDGREPISGDATCWICMSYNRFAERLRAQLGSLEMGRLRYLIEDWTEFFTNKGATL